MTPNEHARVWRKIEKAYASGGNYESDFIANFSDAAATAYEEAAKEQEGRN